jgi:15-cis-phytoene synthase
MSYWLRRRGERVTVLAEAYARSRLINRVHGRSYYLATRLLPAEKRPHVHALYGFMRRADDIVDALADSVERQRGLDEFGAAFLTGLAGGPVDDPVLPAILHTVATYGLDPGDFDTFLRSMAMDLKVTGYRTYADLLDYMEGSAAVVGTLMMPILGLAPGAPAPAAREAARELGLAFQLTNMIRDVADDLERGRVYLPEEDLNRYAVTRADVARDIAAGWSSEPVRALIRHECERARLHYLAALPGLPMLARRSRVAIRAATLLYGGILDGVRRQGYEVLAGRVRVSRRRRGLLVACAASERLFEARTAAWWSSVDGGRQS